MYLWLSGTEGQGKGEQLLNGCRVSFGVIKSILQLVVMVAHACEYTKSHWIRICWWFIGDSIESIMMAGAKWWFLKFRHSCDIYVGFLQWRQTFLSSSFFLSCAFSVDSSVFQLAVILYHHYVFWCSNCSSLDQREPREGGSGVFLSCIHHSSSLLLLYT